LPPDAARAALAAADDDEQRRHCAEQLGCALAAQQQAPSAHDGPGVWAAAICHVPDKSLALQWLAGLSGDSWLGEVALHGRFAEVRLAAVQRVADAGVLATVARLSRGRDKGVFRHCSDELRQRRQSTERAQHAVQLASALHDLLDHSPLSVSCLLDLQHELQALEKGGEPLPECRSLLEQADARLRQESEARHALEAGRDQAAELATECAEAAWPDPEQFERWRDRHASLAQTQARLPDWLAGKTASAALSASLHQVESRLSALAADQARFQACEQFLCSLADGRIEPGLATAWEALPKPDHPDARARLQARWQSMQALPQLPPEPAPEPRPQAQPRPGIDLTEVRALLERSEQALEAGHVAEAEAELKKVKAAVGNAALRRDLASRLQHAHTRLRELSGWAKWGAERKREHLIAAAEELLAANHGVDELARAVPALREEWKQLAVQATPVQRDWERFDAALVKAYQPVAAKRAEEAAQRAQARQEREELCSRWEALVAAIDWEHPDYAAIGAQREQALKQWRAAARAGFRDERLLRKRFDAMLGAVDQRLVAARTSEVQRREQLIAAAEALREAPDLRAAMSEAKALQERWRGEAGPMRLVRGEEQKLWHRFRGACDAVFARRDAERAEQVAHREQAAQARAALVDAFAATIAAGDAGEIKRALGQFRADWDSARPNAPRAGAGAPADALERRARDLQQQAQQRIEGLHRQAYRARLQALEQRAAPADGLDSGALAAGLEAREALLIDLEIALDLPTPEEFAPARRRRQLERLQNRFRGGRQAKPQAEELLAQWYATPANPNEALSRRVDAVVRKLLEQGQPAGGK
jgi:hypothetical protein